VDDRVVGHRVPCTGALVKEVAVVKTEVIEAVLTRLPAGCSNCCRDWQEQIRSITAAACGRGANQRPDLKVDTFVDQSRKTVNPNEEHCFRSRTAFKSASTGFLDLQ